MTKTSIFNKKFMEDNYNMMYDEVMGCWYVPNQSINSVDCAIAMDPLPKCKEKCKTKKDVNPMNYNAVSVTAPATDETVKQRRYMADRVERDYYEKVNNLPTQFKINPDALKSPKEVQEYIKNGWFTIRGLDDDKYDIRYYDYYGALEFRKEPADKEGYEAAKKALKKARQDAIDVIQVLPLDEGFKAMKAFANWSVDPS